MMLFNRRALSAAAVACCFAPLTDVVALRPSAGCASTNPTQGALEWDATTAFDGGEYSHKYSLPSSYDGAAPAPLLLFFHGYGGSSVSCGSTCSLASTRGYATISLTGIGGSGLNNSWKGFGSNDSGRDLADAEAQSLPGTCGQDTDSDCPADGCPLEDDRTCNTNAYKIKCYPDCDAATCDSNDGCMWTTCKDSVEQTLGVLRPFLDEYCVDLDRIYASGCSNGGMFLYELAHSQKSAVYLAGISPQVGSPHYGYNRGPAGFGTTGAKIPIHHMGFWGQSDGTVPPNEGVSTGRGRYGGCTIPCRSSESGGWFYTTSQCILEKWNDDLALTEQTAPVASYGIDLYGELNSSNSCQSCGCKLYDGGSTGAVVAGCVFDGGHDCNTGYMNDVTLNFFDAVSKICSDDAHCGDGPYTSTGFYALANGLSYHLSFKEPLNATFAVAHARSQLCITDRISHSTAWSQLRLSDRIPYPAPHEGTNLLWQPRKALLLWEEQVRR